MKKKLIFSAIFTVVFMFTPGYLINFRVEPSVNNEIIYEETLNEGELEDIDEFKFIRIETKEKEGLAEDEIIRYNKGIR